MSALTVRTNIPAINTSNHLARAHRLVTQTFERLSSGLRINKAADDAAGLAISDQITADVRSLGQGLRNAEDGVSLVQVYEGGTREITNNLIRLRELAMQSATDTISDRERAFIQHEVDETVFEITRMAESTTYIGQDPILTGQTANVGIQVGKLNDDNVDRLYFAPGHIDLTAEGLGMDGLDLANRDSARDALSNIDEALFITNEARAKVGAMQTRLQTAIDSQMIQIENLTAANSRIRDADMAEESTNLAKAQMIRQAGVAVLAQANQIPSVALQLLQ